MIKEKEKKNKNAVVNFDTCGTSLHINIHQASKWAARPDNPARPGLAQPSPARPKEIFSWAGRASPG
jgi:hypothetical protein